MSSWNKASKTNQREHRERHQPASRAHLGLLEKKKDYRLRAKDRHEKEATLKLLKKRALNRNLDEFYFHMINSRVEGGIHHELDKEDQNTPEEIRLMQSQDLRYINAKRKMESSKIERLQSQLHLIDVADNTENKHTFFVDTVKEATKFDVAAHLDTHPALLARRTNRLQLEKLKKIALPTLDEQSKKKADAHKTQAYKELSKRIKREKQLSIIQQKLEIKKHLQNKTDQPPKRIKPGSKDAPPIYEWPFERKR